MMIGPKIIVLFCGTLVAGVKAATEEQLKELDGFYKKIDENNFWKDPTAIKSLKGYMEVISRALIDEDIKDKYEKITGVFGSSKECEVDVITMKALVNWAQNKAFIDLSSDPTQDQHLKNTYDILVTVRERSRKARLARLHTEIKLLLTEKGFENLETRAEVQPYLDELNLVYYEHKEKPLDLDGDFEVFEKRRKEVINKLLGKPGKEPPYFKTTKKIFDLISEDLGAKRSEAAQKMKEKNEAKPAE